MPQPVPKLPAPSAYSETREAGQPAERAVVHVASVHRCNFDDSSHSDLLGCKGTLTLLERYPLRVPVSPSLPVARRPRRRGDRDADPRRSRARGPDRHRPSGSTTPPATRRSTPRPRPASRSWLVRNTGTEPVWVVSSTLSGGQTRPVHSSRAPARRAARPTRWPRTRPAR